MSTWFECRWVASEQWKDGIFFFFFLLSKVGIFDEEVFLRSFVEGANTCAVVILLWVPKRVEFCGDVLGTMARAQAMRQ